MEIYPPNYFFSFLKNFKILNVNEFFFGLITCHNIEDIRENIFQTSNFYSESAHHIHSQNIATCIIIFFSFFLSFFFLPSFLSLFLSFFLSFCILDNYSGSLFYNKVHVRITFTPQKILCTLMVSTPKLSKALRICLKINVSLGHR